MGPYNLQTRLALNICQIVFWRSISILPGSKGIFRTFHASDAGGQQGRRLPRARRNGLKPAKTKKPGARRAFPNVN
jgi:hypothetical protein